MLNRGWDVFLLICGIFGLRHEDFEASWGSGFGSSWFTPNNFWREWWEAHQAPWRFSRLAGKFMNEFPRSIHQNLTLGSLAPWETLLYYLYPPKKWCLHTVTKKSASLLILDFTWQLHFDAGGFKRYLRWWIPPPGSFGCVCVDVNRGVHLLSIYKYGVCVYIIIYNNI